MPRKRIKGGGDIPQGPGQESDNTMIFLFIGLCIFLLPIIGLVGYYGVYLKTCQDKDDEDNFVTECNPGESLNHKTCDGDCTKVFCCEEKTCAPPANSPPGYDGTSLEPFKSRTDFASGNASLTGVTCSLSEGYIGTAVAKTCGAGDSWTYSGCESGCLKGPNPDAPGAELQGDREEASPCHGRDPSDFDDMSGQKKFCNKYFSNNKFCKLDIHDLVSWHPENKCIEGAPCVR